MDLRDALISELLFSARENGGFFTLYLTNGSTLRARPAGMARGGQALKLWYPDGKKGTLSVRLLDGFSPGAESMLSNTEFGGAENWKTTT